MQSSFMENFTEDTLRTGQKPNSLPQQGVFCADSFNRILGVKVVAEDIGCDGGQLCTAAALFRHNEMCIRDSNKGNLIISVKGREAGRRIGLCAHIDTLGLMVRSITPDGMLMFTLVGGPIPVSYTHLDVYKRQV